LFIELNDLVGLRDAKLLLKLVSHFFTTENPNQLRQSSFDISGVLLGISFLLRCKIWRI